MSIIRCTTFLLGGNSTVTYIERNSAGDWYFFGPEVMTDQAEICDTSWEEMLAWYPDIAEWEDLLPGHFVHKELASGRWGSSEKLPGAIWNKE